MVKIISTAKSDDITYPIRTDAERSSIRSVFHARRLDFGTFIRVEIDSGVSELSGQHIHEEVRQRIAATARSKNK